MFTSRQSSEAELRLTILLNKCWARHSQRIVSSTTWAQRFFSALLSNLRRRRTVENSRLLLSPHCLDHSFHSIRQRLFSLALFTSFQLTIKGGRREKENWKFPKTNMRSNGGINFFYLSPVSSTRVEEENRRIINYLTLDNTALISLKFFSRGAAKLETMNTFWVLSISLSFFASRDRRRQTPEEDKGQLTYRQQLTSRIFSHISCN